MTEGSFRERWQALREEIARVAAESRRNPDEITVVGVSKGHPPERLRAAHSAGLRLFGENRVAELLEKQEALDLPDVEWHFIGHVQRRKAKSLVGRTALIHSVDRLSLAQELSKRATAEGVTVAGLLQVNASGEESKAGWPVFDAGGQSTFLQEVETMLVLPALSLRGLMTMAPFFEDAARTQPVFARVRQLRERLADRFPEVDWTILSMGMTNDYRYAIAEGATHLRIGTALFGPRGDTG